MGKPGHDSWFFYFLRRLMSRSFLVKSCFMNEGQKHCGVTGSGVRENTCDYYHVTWEPSPEDTTLDTGDALCQLSQPVLSIHRTQGGQPHPHLTAFNQHKLPDCAASPDISPDLSDPQGPLAAPGNAELPEPTQYQDHLGAEIHAGAAKLRGPKVVLARDYEGIQRQVSSPPRWCWNSRVSRVLIPSVEVTSPALERMSCSGNDWYTRGSNTCICGDGHLCRI